MYNLINKQKQLIRQEQQAKLSNLQHLAKVFNGFKDLGIGKKPRNRIQKIELIEKAVSCASSKFTSIDVWNALQIAHPEVRFPKSLVLSNIYRLARNKNVKILGERARKDGYLYATAKSN